MAESKLKQIQAIDNPYKFSVSRVTSVFTLTNAAQWYTMDWNSEQYDLNSDFDITTNNDYTAPVTGYYLFTFRLRFAANTSDTLYARIARSGGALARWDYEARGSTAHTMVGSVMLYLTANDVLTLDAQNVNSAASTIANGTYATSWEGHLVSV